MPGDDKSELGAHGYEPLKFQPSRPRDHQINAYKANNYAKAMCPSSGEFHGCDFPMGIVTDLISGSVDGRLYVFPAYVALDAEKKVIKLKVVLATMDPSKDSGVVSDNLGPDENEGVYFEHPNDCPPCTGCPMFSIPLISLKDVASDLITILKQIQTT